MTCKLTIELKDGREYIYKGDKWFWICDKVGLVVINRKKLKIIRFPIENVQRSIEELIKNDQPL